MGWDKLFREIKLICAGYNLPYTAAKLPENKSRNRYRDVSPFDHNRVKLLEIDNDYINASLIELPKADRKYILTQGPLNHTAGHFWQMVWEQKSAAVIMLNKIIEKGTMKCSQYYPLGDEPFPFTEFGFTVTNKRQQIYPNYTVRYLDLQNDKTGKVREIFQFHYTAWPDFGVPESPAAFLDFLNCVRDHDVLESSVGPAVIHCSAGIGRSGTFVLVDSCLIFIEKDIQFDVKETLLELRKQRMGLIQTVDQLRFSYCAIAEGARAMTDKGGDDSADNSETEDSESPYNSSSDENHENDSSTRENNSDAPTSTAKPDSNARKRPAEDGAQNDDKHDEKKGRQSQCSYSHPNDDLEDLPSLPPPPPPRKESLKESNNNEETEIRRRKIAERQESLKNLVNDVKKKMKDSEHRQKNYTWLPYIIGGSILVTACSAAAYYFYR